MKNFAKILQVVSVLLGFAVASGASAATVNPLFPENLPHALPWNDGTTTWTKWIAWKSTTGWQLIYHNSDMDVDSGGYITATPWMDMGHNYFTTGNNGTSWSSSTSNHFTGSPGMYFDTGLQAVGGVPCKEKLYASNTIFAFGSRNVAAYCTDVIPYDVGDALFDRINLMPDNYTFQTTTTDPTPTQIINPDSSEYVDVPSIIDDPKGFVTAMLTNLGIWLYNLVVPDAQFLSDSFTNLRTAIETKFAFYFQIKDAFTVPAASAMTPISLGSLHIGGQTLAPMTFIASFDPAEFASFRAFLSMVLYVGLGFFILRKLSNIFSS